MSIISTIIICTLSLSTPHGEIEDSATVGDIVSLANTNTAGIATGEIARYDATNLTPRISAKYAKPAGGIPMTDLAQGVQQTIYGKQDALVSGTNIKTINGNSLLGSGNIVIQGGGGTPSDYTTTNAVCTLITNNVALWAMAGHTEPQGMGGATATNIAQNVIQRNIDTNYLCTVTAAQAMTNGVMTAANGKFLAKQYSAFDGGITGTIGWSNENAYNYLSVSPMGDEVVRFTASGVYLNEGNWNLLYRHGGEGEENIVTLQEEFTTRDETIGSMQSSIVFLQTGKANVDDVYTKTQINGNTVTNGGAKAYADWTFAKIGDIPSTNGFIKAQTATNIAEAVVGGVMEYGLTNLTGAAVNLASGQIGNITMAANVSVTLDFSAAANRSGDCLLYVANTDGAADHYIVPMQTNDYTFVSADLAKALTMTKATTNLVSFTRVRADTILVSKMEVK